MNFKQNFDLINGRYFCKICGESVSANCKKHYIKHIRDRHTNLSRTIDTQSSWSQNQVEDLVRIVGEFNRQNKGPNYVRGKKIFNWDHIADQMNLSNGCKLSPNLIRKKWDNIVFRLPKASIREAKQMSEINGYVFLIKHKIIVTN